MPSRVFRFLSPSLALLLALGLAACGSGGDDGGGGDGGGGGGDLDNDGFVDDGRFGSTCADAAACKGDLLCRQFGSESEPGNCVPDLGSCDDFDDCPGDSYCDAEGLCTPYGFPPDVINDPACQRAPVPGDVTPTVQCEWEPGEGDDSGQIYTAPMVADFNLDLDPGRLQPSVVVTTWEEANGFRRGTLRVFDGRTCEEQIKLDGAGNWPGYGTQWAIGDLDGDVGEADGRPELVGLHAPNGGSRNGELQLYAVDLNAEQDGENIDLSASVRWYGGDCGDDDVVDTPVGFPSNQRNFGPSLFDLDDDGIPEIIVDQWVFDANGCLLNADEPEPISYADHGLLVAVADVDHDGKVELVRHDRIAEWDEATTEWVDEDYFSANNAQEAGHIAVVDIGNYTMIDGQPSDAAGNYPEVVIISVDAPNSGNGTNIERDGTMRVQTLSGEVVWGPVTIPSTGTNPGGKGGAPTASDFDGDGFAEFAAAANQFYAVYDPDCGGYANGITPRGGACGAEGNGVPYEGTGELETLPEGILWARPSRDYSSSSTGSSIFDFNGDGAAEAVYRDECYLRVYDGPTGEVIFSAAATSGTGYEYPTIVDVDGDFATEIVVPRTDTGPGSGNDARDCQPTDPLFGDGSGVAFERKQGFVILRDPEDRWVASRPIWNQHTYSITHVRDDGSYYRTSEWRRNWTVDGLNNFRQNVQGDLKGLNIADLTVVFAEDDDLCAGFGGTKEFGAQVCNRGTNPVQDGVTVAFTQGESDVCTAITNSLLNPGDCEQVSCSGEISGSDDILVDVDPEGTIADCHPDNNEGAGLFNFCGGILE